MANNNKKPIMPLIQAWECTSTGKLFKDKDVYRSHLKKLARKRLKDRYDEKRRAKKAEFFANMRETCQTVQDIEAFIVKHSDEFWGNGLDFDCWRDKYKFKKPFKLTSASIRLRWKDHCSNSHEAPFNGVTNWDRDSSKPTGYPGWVGQLVITFENDSGCFISNIFKDTGICTGSGGGGSSRYNSSITLFADDWPALLKAKEDKEVLARLLDDVNEDPSNYY